MNREPAEDDADRTVIVGDDDATVIVAPVVDDEATLLVSRPMPDEEETVVGAHPVLDEESTVIVEREIGGDAELDESTLSMQPDDDPTVVVQRVAAVDPDDTVSVSSEASGLDDEATVIVDDDATVHAGPAAESTILLAAAGPTVAVDGADSALPTADLGGAGSSQVRASMAPPRKRRRGELQPAPVPSGFGGMPIVASGAGAVSSYRARTLLAPPASTALSESSASHRLTGDVPSVERRSRRASFVAIAVVAGATLLLAGAVVWALSALIGF